MKKFLVCIQLLVLVMPIYAQANAFDNLTVDTMWIDGNRVANTDQDLHVVFSKKSNAYSFVWQWVLLAAEEGSSSTMNLGTVYTNLAYDKTIEKVLTFKVPKPGTYHFYVAMVGNAYVFKGRNGLTATFIEKYENPNLHTVFTVHMSKPSVVPGGSNTVYGSRICGTVEITNNGTLPFYSPGGLNIALSLPDGQETTFTQSPLDYGVEAGATIIRDFSIDIPYSPGRYTENKERILNLVYTDNDGTHELDDKYHFVILRSTNTYWTGDGQIHDLPVGPDNLLQVPSEALAVDLRGLCDFNTVFTVDASKANPNCLFYLESTDPVPSGLDNQMVVYNYMLKSLTLNEDYDYFCPLPFYAVNVFFTYTPISEQWGKPDNVQSPTMSGTVVVPFDVQSVWLVSVNNVRVLDPGRVGQLLSICHFKTDNDDQLEFESVESSQLKAYKPYLINSVLPSSITFYAEFLTIPATRKAVAHGNQFDFIGTTVGQSASTDMFCWNCDNNYFYQSDAGKRVRPFTAYMTRNNHYPEETYGKLYVNVMPKAATGIVNANRVGDTVNPQTVYTLSGQCVGAADTKYLKPGIYIRGGRKVVVK